MNLLVVFVIEIIAFGVGLVGGMFFQGIRSKEMFDEKVGTLVIGGMLGSLWGAVLYGVFKRYHGEFFLVSNIFILSIPFFFFGIMLKQYIFLDLIPVIKGKERLIRLKIIPQKDRDFIKLRITEGMIFPSNYIEVLIIVGGVVINTVLGVALINFDDDFRGVTIILSLLLDIFTAIILLRNIFIFLKRIKTLSVKISEKRIVDPKTGDSFCLSSINTEKITLETTAFYRLTVLGEEGEGNVIVLLNIPSKDEFDEKTSSLSSLGAIRINQPV